MIVRFRQWLAGLIIGRDPCTRFLIHGRGVAYFMTEQQIRSLMFMTSDGASYYLTRKSPFEAENLCCNVCTNRFDGNADQMTRCPSCGSQDVTLAEREVF